MVLKAQGGMFEDLWREARGMESGGGCAWDGLQGGGSVAGCIVGCVR